MSQVVGVWVWVRVCAHLCVRARALGVAYVRLDRAVGRGAGLLQHVATICQGPHAAQSPAPLVSTMGNLPQAGHRPTCGGCTCCCCLLIMLLAPLLPSPAKTHSPYPHPRPAQTQTQALNPHCCCTFTQRQFYPQTHVLLHAPHRAAGGHRPVQPAAARSQPAAGRGAALRVQAGPRPGPGPGWWVVVELVGMAVVEGHGWGWRFGWRSAARCPNRTTA